MKVAPTWVFGVEQPLFYEIQECAGVKHPRTLEFRCSPFLWLVIIGRELSYPRCFLMYSQISFMAWVASGNMGAMRA